MAIQEVEFSAAIATTPITEIARPAQEMTTVYVATNPEPEVRLTRLAEVGSTHFSVNLPKRTKIRFKFSNRDWQEVLLRNPSNLKIPTLQTTHSFQLQYWEENKWVAVPDQLGNTIIEIPGGE